MALVQNYLNLVWVLLCFDVLRGNEVLSELGSKTTNTEKNNRLERRRQNERVQKKIKMKIN